MVKSRDMRVQGHAASDTCAMCGKSIQDGRKFCDRCFDILVAHREEDRQAPTGG